MDFFLLTYLFNNNIKLKGCKDFEFHFKTISILELVYVKTKAILSTKHSNL